MKIEDQLTKEDLTDVKIPKGIYENLPTIENTITIEDEEEGEDDDEAKDKLKVLDDDQVSQNSLDRDIVQQKRDQYNTTADVIFNQEKPLHPQKLNSKRLNYMN
jgi:hypothetical protein